MTRNRRIVNVRLSIEFILELITTGHEILGARCIDGVPEDAVFIGSFFDSSTNTVIFQFYHDSFSPVPNDGVIVNKHILYERLSNKEILQAALDKINDTL